MYFQSKRLLFNLFALRNHLQGTFPPQLGEGNFDFGREIHPFKFVRVLGIPIPQFFFTFGNSYLSKIQIFKIFYSLINIFCIFSINCGCIIEKFPQSCPPGHIN